MKHLIFHNEKSAIDVENFACQEEGIPDSGNEHIFFHPDKGPIRHPDSGDSRVAVRVPDVLTNRSWYPDFESKAHEVVEELSDDWFGD